MLTGQAKADYQRDYMRRYRRSNVNAAPNVRPKRRSSRFAILQRDNFRCQYCGKTPKDDIKLEVDHIVPLCKDGTDTDDNLITACFDCNRSKAGNRLNYDAEQSIMPSLTLEPPPDESVRPEPRGCNGCALLTYHPSQGMSCPKGRYATSGQSIFEENINPHKDCDQHTTGAE